MKFEIILSEDLSAKSIKWYLASEHSICCAIPIRYFSDDEKSFQINNDLVRKEGAVIHAFLLALNKAYHKTNKFNSIKIYYSDK